jgi:hypothetical protein
MEVAQIVPHVKSIVDGVVLITIQGWRNKGWHCGMGSYMVHAFVVQEDVDVWGVESFGGCKVHKIPNKYKCERIEYCTDTECTFGRSHGTYVNQKLPTKDSHDEKILWKGFK